MACDVCARPSTLHAALTFASVTVLGAIMVWGNCVHDDSGTPSFSRILDDHPGDILFVYVVFVLFIFVLRAMILISAERGAHPLFHLLGVLQLVCMVLVPLVDLNTMSVGHAVVVGLLVFFTVCREIISMCMPYTFWEIVSVCRHCNFNGVSFRGVPHEAHQRPLHLVVVLLIVATAVAYGAFVFWGDDAELNSRIALVEYLMILLLGSLSVFDLKLFSAEMPAGKGVKE